MYKRQIYDNLANVGPTSTTGRRFPPLSYDFYEPDLTRYSRGSSRELIGYLQHVYHNDPSGSLDRKRYVRYEGTNSYGAVKPNWGSPTSVMKLLDKENNTYVPNLLRQNTTKYPLHVSGSCKIIAPYAGSFPISNFKIAGNSGTALGAVSYTHLTLPTTVIV